MELVFVGDRCNDHSPNSGYDQVCSLFPEAGWLSGRALENGQFHWHREPRAGSDLGRSLFHVIYGDCSGRGLPKLLRQRFPAAKIVSSAHQPVVRLKDDAPSSDALRESDAVVAVSRIQATELRDLGLGRPVHSVPHGVWPRVFRPTSPPAPRQRAKVLMVGSFLRDWEGARGVVQALAEAGVGSISLGAGSRKNMTGDGSLVEVPPRASEAELARLYDECAVLFLPFLEATASNALLEAMSAGCPVVCPRLPSLVEEYLENDEDSFAVGRYDDALSRLLHYVRNPAVREAKSAALMARAAAFDWARLKPRFEAIYRSVVEGRTLEDVAVAELTGARVWSTTLAPGERSAWRDTLRSHDGPVESPGFLEFAIQATRRHIPASVSDALDRLRRGGSEVALLIRGLPIDEELPPTPIRGNGRKATHSSEALLLGLGGQLGEPIAYRDEKDGALVQDVFPREEERASPSNESFDVSLDLHTEVAFVRGEPFRRTYEGSPDFLLLLCLRSAPDADAFTRVVGAGELLSRLGSEERRVLAEPRFRLRAPYSFTRGGDQTRPFSDLVPLVYPGNEMCLDLACGSEATDSESRHALAALRNVVQEGNAGERLALEAGDVLVIDNRRALHGRSAFKAHGHGRDRWIQRVYVRRRRSGSTD